MTEASDESLRTLQHEVHRLLGLCLLRLQTYECWIKVILEECDISGVARSENDAQVGPTTDVNRKTLGALAGEFLGSFLTSDRNAEVSSDPSEDGLSSFRMRIHVELSPDDFARTESGLKELVLLRNNLVHHFFEQHDLGSPDGCRAAKNALILASDQIKHHLEDLRERLEDLVLVKQRVAEYFNTEENLRLLEDSIVHGKIPWRHTVIVSALHEATTELARDGWTPVDEAEKWVLARHPEERPEYYGCRSLRQIIHESGLFELHPRQPGERHTTRYRVRIGNPTLH